VASFLASFGDNWSFGGSLCATSLAQNSPLRVIFQRKKRCNNSLPSVELSFFSKKGALRIDKTL
jgi:hypothetical protein